MENKALLINADQLKTLLENKENVTVLDVRPKNKEKNGKYQEVFM